MLVLSRKAQEKIRIGDDITITILKVKGKAVRVGIEAPSATPVLRGELTFEPEQHERRLDSSPSDKPAPTNPKETPRPEEWPRDPRSSVSHTRVARSRVNSVLPTMLGDAGPLRAMLDRRGVTHEV